MALLSALSLLLCPLASAQDAPRLRTIMGNEAIILVETLPKAKYVSVQLFASNRYLEDEQTVHGYRHLLEHLLLKGKNKDIDIRLEKQGIWLMGRTLRDAIQIEFTCAPDQVDVSLSALKELLQPIQVSSADIKAEVETMRQELALQTDAQKLSSAAWEAAYGPEGLDPWGSIDSLSSATPEALAEIQKILFSPKSLVLVISGPVDIESNTSKAKKLLEDLRDETHNPKKARGPGTHGRSEIESAFGEARGARVGGYRDMKTACGLAAGLGLASSLDNAFVTYTPTGQNGLIIIGRTDENGGVGTKIDEMSDADAAGLFTTGKLLAERWVDRQLANPSDSAFFRGLLLTQGASYRPEQLLENIRAMDWKQFLTGVALFRKENADIAVGVRH